MNWLLACKAFVLGLVEGLTEFLPVSSTGHLIVASELLHFTTPAAKSFEIFIQLGAVLAVCWHYRQKLIFVCTHATHSAPARSLIFNVLIAFAPAAVLGFFGHAWLMENLFTVRTVAIGLIAGGFILLWVERLALPVRVDSADNVSSLTALKIGLVQILSLIPGTSRAAATIIGGRLFGLSRHAATEFSFYLSVPTLGAASLYSLFIKRGVLAWNDWYILAIGLVSAFISALLVIRAFLFFVSRYDFTIFGIYRIVAGTLLLIFFI